MTGVLKASAPAKINLTLEVLGVREDGYHEVDTILQALELSDEVELRNSDQFTVTASGPRAAGTPLDESNLALKAAQRLIARHGGPAVAVHLEKRIPPAGGLGGGASDAATVLKLLGESRGLLRESLETVANEIGSDEAFFLVGGTARAQGRGERVTVLPDLARHDVVLFIPARTIERKTPRMFAALDRHRFDDGAVTGAFAERPPEQITMESTFNAFERVAFDLFPWLAALWEDLEARTGETIRLCGAGPCMFWLGPIGGDRIAHAAAGADCEVILTRTVAR